MREQCLQSRGGEVEDAWRAERRDDVLEGEEVGCLGRRQVLLEGRGGWELGCGAATAAGHGGDLCLLRGGLLRELLVVLLRASTSSQSGRLSGTH